MQTATPKQWKQVESLDESKSLVDLGVILNWRDAKRIHKVLKSEEVEQLVNHIAVLMAERVQDRLPEEILVETLLNLLATGGDETYLQAFLESLLVQPERTAACLRIVEIALTSESSEEEFDDDVFAMAVSIICELGLAIRDIERAYPGQIERSGVILDHISTYLLSVSNSNNNAIRLSLLNYFGSTESNSHRRAGFNKIMSRFGHTVLDHLFQLLFKKKTEAVALQYLLENLPYILEGDRHAQRIVHETWKFYMLKKPQRFGLFIQTFANHLISLPREDAPNAMRVFCQHLGALLTIVSEVNHRSLAREIICAIVVFRNDPECRQAVEQLTEQNSVKGHVKDLLLQLKTTDDVSRVIESASRFVQSKRGRKPSFQRVQGLLTVNQVRFLGSHHTAKAS